MRENVLYSKHSQSNTWYSTMFGLNTLSEEEACIYSGFDIRKHFFSQKSYLSSHWELPSQQPQARTSKRAYRVFGGFAGWRAKDFEEDTFSAALKPDMSLNRMAVIKVAQITHCLLALCNVTFTRRGLFPVNSPTSVTTIHRKFASRTFSGKEALPEN